MRILIIGASGMLGNAMMRVLSQKSDWQVYGTVRSEGVKRFFETGVAEYLLSGVDVEQHDALVKLFARVRPDVVVNCVGLVKQLADAGDPLVALPLNAMLPHRLARLCELTGARLVHMSTDCVFSGRKGGYRESDMPDAEDVYGRSKLLGEVTYPHAITLRTSIIGHELAGERSLVDWFLSQKGTVKGFKRAIFSGLPAVEVALVIRDHVIPHPELCGLYHLSAEPINKFDLLELVAEIYGKSIEITADEHLVIDRSLDSSRFRKATGFTPKPWPKLITSMHDFG